MRLLHTRSNEYMGDTPVILPTIRLPQDWRSIERLAEKKKTMQEEGMDTVAKPQRTALLPTRKSSGFWKKWRLVPPQLVAGRDWAPPPPWTNTSVVWYASRFHAVPDSTTSNTPSPRPTSSMVVASNPRHGKPRLFQLLDPRSPQCHFGTHLPFLRARIGGHR